MLENTGRYNPEARAMLKQSEDTMKQIADKFDELMTRSYAFREALGLNENGENGEVKLSAEEFEQTEEEKTQIKEDTIRFGEQIDKFKKNQLNRKDVLVMIFRRIGFSNMPMTMDQLHVRYVLYGTKNADHHMGEAMLRKLPELLADPLAIITSETFPEDSVMVLVDAVHNGKRVTMPIRVTSKGQCKGIELDVNHMSSAQGRKNGVSRLLTNAIVKDSEKDVHVFT